MPILLIISYVLWLPCQAYYGRGSALVRSWSAAGALRDSARLAVFDHPGARSAVGCELNFEVISSVTGERNVTRGCLVNIGGVKIRAESLPFSFSILHNKLSSDLLPNFHFSTQPSTPLF